MEAFVGSFWSAFSGKHSRRVFSFSFEWIQSCGERKFSRHVFLQIPTQNISPSLIFGQGNFWNRGMRKRFGLGFNLDFLVSNLEGIKRFFVPIHFLFPSQDDFPIMGIQIHFYLVELMQQQIQENLVFGSIGFLQFQGSWQNRIFINSSLVQFRDFSGNRFDGFENAV